MPTRFMTRKPEYTQSFFVEQIIAEFEDRATCARELGDKATRPVDFDAVATHVHDLFDTPFSASEEANWQHAEAAAYDDLRYRGMIS